MQLAAKVFSYFIRSLLPDSVHCILKYSKLCDNA